MKVCYFVEIVDWKIEFWNQKPVFIFYDLCHSGPIFDAILPSLFSLSSCQKIGEADSPYFIDDKLRADVILHHFFVGLLFS